MLSPNVFVIESLRFSTTFFLSLMSNSKKWIAHFFMAKYFVIFFLCCASVIVAQNEVIYIWSGAVTHNSVKVNAKLTNASATVRLVVDDDSTFSSPSYSGYYSVDASTNYMVSMTINALMPETHYFYCVESGGIKDNSPDDVGSFTTFGNGAFSFSFTAGSCNYIPNHAVFDVMKSFHPNFHITMGDLHYMNPNSAVDINAHRLPYETEVLSIPRQSAFFKATPIAYVWDDHDFCGNDSDSSYVGRENARTAYHEYVPHYPLGLGTGINFPINQAFTVGRVRFVMTDLRSTRYVNSIMTEEQKQWFRDECTYARDNNLIIAWVNSTTWNNTTETWATDNWYGFNSDRIDFGNFFLNDSIKNMFMLCGDAHMLAIDDGTNADFSFTHSNPYKYPIFQAAALSGWGSYKGGLFSEGGIFVNPGDDKHGQFGLITVVDNGLSDICIDFKGYRVDSSGTIVTLMNSYNFCRDLTPLSVDEKDAGKDVSIAPNPSAELKLVFKNVVKLKSIIIYDASGKLIFRNNSAHTDIQEYTVKTKNLNAGKYFVEIEFDKTKVTKAWIKNN